jgi:tellurite resistance protein TehA-like permease
MLHMIEYLARHNPLPTIISSAGVSIFGASLGWLDVVSITVGIGAGLMAIGASAFAIAVSVKTLRLRKEELERVRNSKG